MYELIIALLILFLSFFIKEGFDPYEQKLRVHPYPDQTKYPNLVFAEMYIQEILNNGVTETQKKYLDDLLNLLQFI